MKITIKGDDITPDKIAAALASCERDHGLKIKNATIYVRLEDHLGRTVEPLQDGHEITREFTFRKPQPVKVTRPEPVDPISARVMMELCQNKAHRSLSAPEMTALMELAEAEKVDRRVFLECLDRTVTMTGGLSFAYFMKLLKHRIEYNKRA